MVTARRSSETANTYENTSSAGGVGVLEKTRAYSAPVNTPAPEKQESTDAARERMQKNLDRLLNYDRYSAQKLDEPVQEEIAVAEISTTATESIQKETGEDGFSLENILTDTDSEDRLVEKISLRQAIEQLPQRDAMVIKLRYFHGLTQERVSKVLSVSQVQVSRIEKKALYALRELMV